MTSVGRRLREHCGKTARWQRVRVGWYVAGATGGESYVHIRRCKDTHPSWGWDVFQSDNMHSYERHDMIHAGIRLLDDAKTEAEITMAKWKAQA